MRGGQVGLHQVDACKPDSIAPVDSKTRRPSRFGTAAACVISKKDHCRALNAFCLCDFRNHVAVVHQMQIHRLVRYGGVARGDGVGHATVSADGLLDEVAAIPGRLHGVAPVRIELLLS